MLSSSHLMLLASAHFSPPNFWWMQNPLLPSRMMAPKTVDQGQNSNFTEDYIFDNPLPSGRDLAAATSFHFRPFRRRRTTPLALEPRFYQVLFILGFRVLFFIFGSPV